MKIPSSYPLCIPNIRENRLPYEVVVARRWWALPPGTPLPLLNGGTCELVFSGRAGGPAGPDVCDAVLVFASGEAARVGDVEFHVRSSDWVAHNHHSDARYNNVILHVVLLCDDMNSTRCQNGASVPVCSLNDTPAFHAGYSEHSEKFRWPCHAVIRTLDVAECDTLLQRAGLLRFEQKTHAFVELLHAEEQARAKRKDWYNACLLPMLAEALAYGRDRAFFRAAGKRLLGLEHTVPEPLGRTPAPSPLDARRLDVLRKLVTREQDVWGSLRARISEAQEWREHQLRTYFRTRGLSLARTDILLCNVVLPFAAAVALVEQDTLLGERTQRLYETHPTLSSNMITRMMTSQLLLPQEPHGSCRQQGLHYIYQQTCRAKHCADCIMGRRIL